MIFEIYITLEVLACLFIMVGLIEMRKSAIDGWDTPAMFFIVPMLFFLVLGVLGTGNVQVCSSASGSLVCDTVEMWYLGYMNLFLFMATLVLLVYSFMLSIPTRKPRQLT
jgi:hypothetical protein